MQFDNLKPKLKIIWKSNYIRISATAQKMDFSIKDFFSKCDQNRSFLRIWSHLLKKFLNGKLHFLWSVRLVQTSRKQSWKVKICFDLMKCSIFWNYQPGFQNNNTDKKKCLTLKILKLMYIRMMSALLLKRCTYFQKSSTRGVL